MARAPRIRNPGGNHIPSGYVLGRTDARVGEAQLLAISAIGGGLPAAGAIASLVTTAASAVSMNMTATGNTTGSSSATTRAITAMTISGAGAASVGFTGNTILVSVPAVVASAASMNMTATGNTTGSSSATTRVITAMTISGAGAASVGFTGNTILVSVPAVVASATSMNMTATGNTTGSSSATTCAITAMSISGAGDISVGFTGNTILISGSAPGAAATSVNMTAIGNTTGSSSATTRILSEMTLSGAGGVSVGYSGNSIIISGATGGAGGATSMNMTATGGTTGATTAMTRAITELTLSGAGGIAVGFSGGTVVIRAAAQRFMTALGNTIAATSAASNSMSAMSVSGAGAVSIGFDTNSVMIISAATQTPPALTISAVGNTTAATDVVALNATITFKGMGDVSVGMSAGSVIISGPTMSFYEPYAIQASQTINPAAGIMFAIPLNLPVPLAINQVRFLGDFLFPSATLSVGVATGSDTLTASQGFAATHSLVLYTRVNATTYSSIASTTLAWGMSQSWSVSQSLGTNSCSATISLQFGAGTTTSATTWSGSSNAVLSSAYTLTPQGAASTLYTGLIGLVIPWATTFGSGLQFLGILGSTSTATATQASSITIGSAFWSNSRTIGLGAAFQNSGAGQIWPGVGRSQFFQWGQTSAVGSTAPTSIIATALSVKSAVPYVQMGML